MVETNLNRVLREKKLAYYVVVLPRSSKSKDYFQGFRTGHIYKQPLLKHKTAVTMRTRQSEVACPASSSAVGQVKSGLHYLGSEEFAKAMTL